MMLGPPGEMIQVRNYTSKTIKDLYYRYSDYPVQKVGKIHSEGKESFFIITTNLQEDCDLILYFASEMNQEFIFPKAIKRKRGVFNYSYLFLKIVDEDHHIRIIEDLDGEKEFKSDKD